MYSKSLYRTIIQVKKMEKLLKIRDAPKFKRPWKILREARTSILFLYLICFTLIGAISYPLLQYMVYKQVDQRVEENLEEEVENFREEFQKWQEQDPPSIDFKTFIDNFLNTNIPEDDNYFLFYLDDKFYRSEPKALTKLFPPGSEVKNLWSTERQKGKKKGEIATREPEVGNILYRMVPLSIDSDIKGQFYELHTTYGERQEAIELFKPLAQVIAGVIILSFAGAWIATGIVLRPVRELSLKASSISQDPDLSKRLPIKSLSTCLPIEGSGEMYQLTITFNQMMDRLEQVFEHQKEFMRDVNHQLRTPITCIQGHLEVMGDDPQEKQQTLELVFDEIGRIERLLGDLSLLAKSDRPDFLRWETVEIEYLTSEIYQKAKVLAKRKWKLEVNAQGKIIVDRQKLTEAIMNLVENAVKHTQEQDQIIIGSSLHQEEIRFWVRDSGEGIPPEEQKQIFQRFFRGKNRHSFGSGLGLSIVQVITAAHSGKVQLWSRPQIGSEFILVIPLAKKSP